MVELGGQSGQMPNQYWERSYLAATNNREFPGPGTKLLNPGLLEPIFMPNQAKIASSTSLSSLYKESHWDSQRFQTCSIITKEEYPTSHFSNNQSQAQSDDLTPYLPITYS